jgi:hypothetical protein
MSLSLAFDFAVAAGAVICVALQFATFRMARDPILRAGRALLLAGWTIGAIRMSYLLADTGDLPLPALTQIWVSCLELGTIFVTLHWTQHREQEGTA